MRYDLFGLDSGLDDGATNKKENGEDLSNNNDDADEADFHANMSQASSKVNAFSKTATQYLVNFVLRFAIAWVGLTFATFRITIVVAHIGTYGVICKKVDFSKKDKLDYLLFGAGPLLFWLPYWSGKGGWIFWLLDAFLLTCVLFLDSVLDGSGLPFPLKTVVLPFFFLPVLLVTFYTQGYFWPNLCILLLASFCLLVVTMFVPLVEMVVAEAVEEMLGVYSKKYKVAMEFERSKIREEVLGETGEERGAAVGEDENTKVLGAIKANKATTTGVSKKKAREDKKAKAKEKVATESQVEDILKAIIGVGFQAPSFEEREQQNEESFKAVGVSRYGREETPGETTMSLLRSLQQD